MRFVMLVPKSLDPAERARKLPLPDPRPSAQIAKLFPQTLPAKGTKDQAAAPAAVAQASTTGAAIGSRVPLPEARPATAPVRPPRHLRRFRGVR
jgi:membrane-bound lytic murein transglycosylase A